MDTVDADAVEQTDDARARAVAAMAEAVAEHGYAATTVEDVVTRARMSRRTFYGLFGNREECFLAAYDVARERTMSCLGIGRAEPVTHWPAHLQDALASVLEYFAARPALARVLVVEAPAAGTPGLERHERTMHEIAVRLTRARRPASSDPDLAAEATLGAVHRIVHARIVAGRAGELPALAPRLAALVRDLGSGEA